MKKALTIFSALFIISCFSQAVFSQTSNWPRTLLWRISGKDLKKPSYLFGTMHLQDKRVFNLGDSFYYHFERSEGFAVEINFNEYMDSLLSKIFSSLEQDKLRSDYDNEAVKDEDVKIDVADTAIAAPPDEEPPGIEIKKPSKKLLRKLRNERIKRLLIHGEMPTILDAYLYGIAMKQSKWLGAVEDVSDQLNLRDELGKDLDDDEAIQPDDKFLFTLENMIKIYLDQDLNGIEKHSLNNKSEKWQNIVFNRRNMKMVKSIDSLSHQRSMFYAVGAAHLPGDSGLVKLLREKGYTVTPVYSTSKLAAGKYAENLPSKSWYEVHDTAKFYSIQMPGIPTEYNLFGELVKMKVFIDITTLSFYMTGSTIAQYSDDRLEEALRDMAGSISHGGKVESIKKIDRKDVKAVEGSVYDGGVFYRVQLAKKNNLLYFIMMGAEKKQGILSKDADKYFASFKPLENLNAGKAIDWKELNLPEKGLKVRLPSEPKINKAFEKSAEGSGWMFTVYDCTDASTGMYFLIQVRDIEAGKYLNGDSAYFKMYKDQLGTNLTDILIDTEFNYKGFPALRYDGIGERDVFYKSANIIRGNRIYALMAIGQASKKDDPAAEKFFDSFEMTAYKAPQWKTHNSPDNTFTAWGADSYKLDLDDDKMLHYVSYNANEAVSYEVIKTAVPKYYWTDSDTSFYEKKFDGYNHYNNKVISEKDTKNGNLMGREKVIQMPQNNNLMRLRMFLHGDTLYTLMCFIATQYINNENHEKFFEEFRVKNDKIKSTVEINKAEKLFEALRSKDSTTFAEAAAVFNTVEFKKSDLAVLHKALLEPYIDDTVDYYSIRSRIVTALKGISDSSTVDFIRKNYDNLTGDKEKYKEHLLDVLADQQTVYSYAELKDLLLNHLPKETKGGSSISYSLTDSLLLTRQLFPELLTLSRDNYMWKDVMDCSIQLLDSSMINLEMIKPYEKDILFHIDTLLTGTAIKEEYFWGWSYIDVLRLAGRLNSKASNEVLQKLSKFKDLELKSEAVCRLLENNQTVDAKEIEKLAASNEYRLSLYEDLGKIKKLSFFPAKYKAQRYFAEAELYTYDDEDYTPSSMELVGEREAIFDGKKQKFYLFKLIYEGETEKDKTAYLGVAGPFDLDAKKIETSNDVTAIEYEEEFDKKKINEQFEKFLKQGEEYLIERKKWKEENK